MMLFPDVHNLTYLQKLKTLTAIKDTNTQLFVGGEYLQ